MGTKSRTTVRLAALALALAGLTSLAGCRCFLDRLGGGGGGCGGGGGGGCCRGVNPEPRAADACPVSGEKLGAMGQPVPVEVEGRTVLVCCEGCAGRLKRDPGRYLGGTKKGGAAEAPPRQE